ncbi:MAG: hypothetical protein U5L45_01675 [Saprospiraceae bacterium]|nr:hypothetical protein [Saprospiraceae bacterium]
MERIGIYKDLVVSYKEFEDALLRLGYRKTFMEDGWKLYINDEHGASVRINPRNTPDKMMMLAMFAGEAYSMEMMGVLEHRDDIAKMIEQDRLEALAREKNTPASAAA